MSGSSGQSRLDDFEAMEQRYDLFAYRVDGWSAWRVMRNPVHRMVVGLPLSEPTRSNSRRSLRALFSTMKLVAQLIRGCKKDVLVKTCRSGLRMRQGTQFRDVYFDGLLQRGYSVFKLEEVNSPHFDREAAAAVFPADLDPIVFTFWGRVLGMLRPVRVDGFCKQVSTALFTELGVTVEPKWLRMRVSTAYWQGKLYGLLLGRLRPSTVLVSDTGEYGLNIACKRRGVRFIELQHGVFDAAHPDAIPAWVEGDAAALMLPDVLACRGTYWIEQLASTRQGRDHAVPVGNELIDLARVLRRQRPQGQCVNLVLTSQGLDSEQLGKWVTEMVNAAPSDLNWKLSVKLHPLYDMTTTAFDGLKSHPRVVVIGGAEQPNVYDLLADADMHLSIASACHFDAVALGVPSAVIPLAGHKPMLEVLGNGISLAHTPADVWRNDAWEKVSEQSTLRYAQPGFVENLQHLLS